MVSILMATFNGESYIKSQIYSLLSQTYTNWQLLIHDDGSSDKTIAIIKEFEKIDSRIKLIDDGIIHLGPGRNFWHLLEICNSEFICFCDQDDVWLPNNLEIKVSHILKLDNKKPQLICFNGYSWFPTKNNFIGAKCVSKPKFKSFKDILFINGGLQGSSIIINRRLKDFTLSFPLNKIWMHDQILTFDALINKCIHFFDIPLMLYRQHDKNVSGHVIQKRDMLRFYHIFSKVPILNKDSYDSISEYFEVKSKIMNRRDKKIFESFLNLPNNIIIKFWEIFKSGFSHNGSRIRLLSKLFIRPFMDK